MEPSKKIEANVLVCSVYGWFRPSIRRYLYIGASKHALVRINSHGLIGRSHRVLEGDEFHFWQVHKENLWSLEKLLIKEHAPIYQEETPWRKKNKRSLWAKTNKDFEKRNGIFLIPWKRKRFDPENDVERARYS